MNTNLEKAKEADTSLKEAFLYLASYMKQICLSGKWDVDVLQIYYSSIDQFCRWYHPILPEVKALKAQVRYIADQLLVLIHTRTGDHVRARQSAALIGDITNNGLLKGRYDYHERYINGKEKTKKH